MSFWNLVRTEMRRALHRRVVWGLVAVALTGVALLGVVAFFDSAGKSVAELGQAGTHPARMRDWWVPGGGDGTLLIGAIPLMIGGMLGGASVAGAEWRAGTITTVLTWEPRRLRLHGARALSAFVLAALIAAALQALFLAAALPAVLTHGTTSGTDGAWWLALLAAVARIAALTGATALFGLSLATLGRSTGFAFGVGFAWLAVAEAMVRGMKPRLAPWLLGENAATIVTWARLEGAPPGSAPSSGGAALRVTLYVLALVALGAVAFRHRDVAGAS